MTSNLPPLEIEPTLAAIAHALLRTDRTADASLLATATAQIEEVGYDNWNGGTTVWELGIQIPYPDFLALADERRSDIETFINNAVEHFLPERGDWVHAKIRPAKFTDPNWRRNVTARTVEPALAQTKGSYETENYAFISYQTTDKLTAARVQRVLADVGISSFLAHEDIEVSVAWREKILEEIGRANLFVSILSKHYLQSAWCMQEAGIAAFRNLTSIHLSIDGTIPTGFSSNVQSAKINADTFTISNLLPGIVSKDFDLGLRVIIKTIGGSKSYRSAEETFRLILPYIDRMQPAHHKLLLETCRASGQIHHASRCASDYIPPLLAKHGHLLDTETREFLENVCQQYR